MDRLEPWAVPLAGPRAVAQQQATRGSLRNALGKIRGGLTDAILLLLGILLFPVAILLLGTPVALLVRSLLEIMERI